MKKVLIAGESWISHTTHIKGFDAFYTSTYETGVKWLQSALEAGGYQVVYLPNHEASDGFPYGIEELEQYSCVILSDIGANTLLLPDQTFVRLKAVPNRCNLIRDYVLRGGGLVMVGGYLTFSGVDAKGKWQDTAVQEVLPVTISATDDRAEHCEGVAPVVEAEHPAIAGIPRQWPSILGYNRTRARPEAAVPVTVGGDPLLAFGHYGEGRSAAMTTDCAPHWAPLEFVQWPHYNRLWQGIVDYVTER